MEIDWAWPADAIGVVGAQGKGVFRGVVRNSQLAVEKFSRKINK